MPRLDNQSQDVAEYYGFNKEKIEDRPLVDLCQQCADEWETADRDDVTEHPPYEEQNPPYICFDCGVDLDKWDN